LREKGRIREVFNRGRSLGAQGAKLFALKNDLEYNRICFALPRKFGNAVERNRARRLGREAYRQLRPRLRGGFDLVLLVYPKGADFARRMEQLQFLSAKAGLLRE
jgi:ribonuclease P protein component